MPITGGARKYKILHDAASATATGGVLECTTAEDGAFSVAVFQISGTFSASVAFECTVDGTNWVAMECTASSDSTTVATSATAAGVWRATVLGYSKVRANLTWTSGTSITVVGQLVA